MEINYSSTSVIPVSVFCDKIKGEWYEWRHSIGHGGINSFPLPPKVQQGLAACKPRLVRTFIQEYFNIYPEHGVYNWKLLDPYMDSLAASGGKVAASITIKPKPLYPVIDQKIVMPNDIAEWQQVIEALVRRYSIEKEIVTYWEIGNETDIGESGGCPYITATSEEYNEYYKITQEAVLAAFPKAKVGGPAVANAESPLVEGLLKYCSEQKLQLDFISWHWYSKNPQDHARHVGPIKNLIKHYYGDRHIETLVTEMGRGGWDEPFVVEENPFCGSFPASIGAAVFAMMDTGIDWTFYYHIWDQVFVADQFRPFYKNLDFMLIHWNKNPSRFGLFGVCGEVRPTYFVYRMLQSMSGEELEVKIDSPDLQVKASKSERCVSVMLINYNMEKQTDIAATVDFTGIKSGLKLLSTYKLDGSRNWDEDSLELKASERRYIDIDAHSSQRPFFCHVLCPANSVVLVRLENACVN